MVRSLTLAALAAVAATATPAVATAAVAPGRSAFSAATRVPVSNVDAGGATEAVALPDGGAAMLVPDGAGIVAARVRADGAPDGSFGDGGIARVAVPGGVFSPARILRQPDGRFLVVGGGRAAGNAIGPQPFLVARLTASGAPDPSFGSGGVVTLALQVGCGSCSPAAIAPDGSIVLTGMIGGVGAAPGRPGRLRWVVQRLTPSGAVDPAFGSVVLAGTAGYATVVRPSGQIVVLGGEGATSKLAGLTVAGAPDPSFNGGAPAALPTASFAIQLRTGGAIDALGNGSLMRFTPAGALDPSFGTGGVVAIGDTHGPAPAMLPAVAGAITLVLPSAWEPTSPTGTRMRVQRVTAAGVLVDTRDVTPAFGGGIASRYPGGVEQNSFRGTAVARPDGSLLMVGGVSVVRYTGEGAGFSTGLVAVAALTPRLTPNVAFGGPQAPARARVLIPAQRVRTALRLNRVVARITTSGAGLVRVRVRDGRGRTLAESVEPAFAAGTATARVTLTPRGRRLLRHARKLKVSVRYDFRDVLTGRARGAATSRLGS